MLPSVQGQPLLPSQPKEPAKRLGEPFLHDPTVCDAWHGSDGDCWVVLVRELSREGGVPSGTIENQGWGGRNEWDDVSFLQENPLEGTHMHPLTPVR